MSVEDEFLLELFHWMEKQEECANYLVNLAKELEEMREVMNAGQIVGNTVNVLGSVALVGTGIATFLTGGLAAPLLVGAANVTAGVGTVANLACTLLETWKSSKTMKNAQKTASIIEEICKNIERLQEKLSEECKSQGLLSFSDVQYEITAKILRAMAKRSGRNLTLVSLIHLLKNIDLSGGLLFDLSTRFFTTVGNLVGILFPIAKVVGKTGRKYASKAVKPVLKASKAVKPVLKASKAVKPVLKASKAVKPVFNGVGKVAGALVLAFTIHELIGKCEDLIENKHETECSSYLRRKADEMRDAVKKIKNTLTELQEMLSEIPETECHIDLAIEMCGNQRYTRGTISVESKKTKMQDKKKKDYILISTKDMCETKTDDKSKLKSAVNSNNKKREGNDSGEKKKEEEKREKKFRLPTITMSNVRSLSNKMLEIKEKLKNDEFFASDLIFFTETWLNKNSRSIDLDGYAHTRVDRDAELTKKRRGGGMIMLVKEDWASDVKVEHIWNTPDYEVMDVSIKPHDHPQDAPPLTFIHVYVPGPNFDKAAADIIHIYCDALVRSGFGPAFLLGDFNRCEITLFLRYLYQYVTCLTRYNKILDLCYGNVRRAYRSVCRAPLGRSDHNVIHLIPKDQYKLSIYGECKHDHTKPIRREAYYY